MFLNLDWIKTHSLNSHFILMMKNRAMREYKSTSYQCYLMLGV